MEFMRISVVFSYSETEKIKSREDMTRQISSFGIRTDYAESIVLVSSVTLL